MRQDFGPWLRLGLALQGFGAAMSEAHHILMFLYDYEYVVYWRNHSLSGSTFPQLEDLIALRKRLESEVAQWKR